MEASFDGPAELRALRAAWRGGGLPVEDLAVGFESILGRCDWGGDRASRDLPPRMRRLVNDLELIRHTTGEASRPGRIDALLVETAAAAVAGAA
jgi:hypothetical protein